MNNQNNTIINITDSAFDFIRVVWPAIKSKCGGGELIPVETVTDSKFTKLLDIKAGIDAWQAHQEKGIRGIASRVQWGCKFKSFTQRALLPSGVETEIHKRLRTFRNKNGYLFPYLTIHAYLCAPRREGELIYICVVKTEDLYQYIDYRIKNNIPLDRQINPEDGNKFDIIWVNELKKYGIKVHEVENEKWKNL